MAGPRGQLRWEVVRFEKEGREGREDELHGKEKERFLPSFALGFACYPLGSSVFFLFSAFFFCT
jgi:hypothetical protein